MNTQATPRFVVAIVAAFAGVAAGVLLGLADVALLVTPWFILLLLGLGQRAPRAPRISVTSSVERAIAGDTVDFITSVEVDAHAIVELAPVLGRPNRSDDSATTSALASPEVTSTVLAARPGEASEAIAVVTFDTWGAWRLQGHRLAVTSRYGLFRSEYVDTNGANLRVHPRTEELRRLLAPRFLRRSTGRHTARTVGPGIEFADIRPFAAGDEMRAINWRATARSGSLQVADRHPERAGDIILLVDTFIEPGHNIERVLSLTVNAAIAASSGHLGLHDRVGVVEFGGLIRWLPPRVGRLQLHRITDFLLASQTFANQSDKRLPLLAPSVWPPRSTVIAISPMLDPRFVESLYEARRRGHDVAVVEVDGLDPIDLGTQTEPQQISTRLVVAERAMTRRRLSDHAIAAVKWEKDDPVDVPLAALSGVRQRLRVRQ